MELESNNFRLLSQMVENSNRMLEILTKQTAVIQSQSNALAALQAQSVEQGRALEVLGRIGLRDVLSDARMVIQSRQFSMLETVEELARGKSIARWGDGEMKLMLQPEFDLMYQKASPDLAHELREMLLDYDARASHLLLALPTFFPSRLWMGILAENWNRMKPILEASTAKWANTHISRPLFFQRHGADAVAAWRTVWNEKRVCIIAGRGSKFELLPELFNNVASITRIDSEPADAYASLDELKQRLEQMDKVDQFLIALGPSGTVLAGHLSSEAGGFRQAIDIGHLASSYLNVFKGGKTPEQLPTRK